MSQEQQQASQIINHATQARADKLDASPRHDFRTQLHTVTASSQLLCGMTYLLSSVALSLCVLYAILTRYWHGEPQKNIGWHITTFFLASHPTKK